MENFLLTDEIIFDSKPEAVPYNYRISYKIAQMCLIISKNSPGRSGCTLVKIHIIANALNTKECMEELEAYVNEKTGLIIVRFDPVVNRAIRYAVADGLIMQLQNGKYRLTGKGKEFIKQIEKENVMSTEKDFLFTLGNRLTDAKVEQLMGMWRYKNAEN